MQNIATTHLQLFLLEATKKKENENIQTLSIYTHHTLIVHSSYTHCTLIVHSLYTHRTFLVHFYCTLIQRSEMYAVYCL